MELREEFQLKKKKIKMKYLILLLGLFTFCQMESIAQGCVDTVRIRGYFVGSRETNEMGPRTKRNGDTIRIEMPVDTHYDETFIPIDSISKKFPLSYWLDHFYHQTKEVFISCKKFRASEFISGECLANLGNPDDSCRFPSLHSERLYETSKQTGTVYSIYYLDAVWGRIKMTKGTPKADLVPGAIAQTSISPHEKQFLLYVFIRAKSLQVNPKINDPHVTIWKKMK